MQPSPTDLLALHDAPERRPPTVLRHLAGIPIDMAAFVDLSDADCPAARRDLLDLWRSAERDALLAGEWCTHSTN